MESDSSNIIVRVANEADSIYAIAIVTETESSAKARGTGISKRHPEDVIKRMKAGNAVIALTASGEWVGFSYLEVWSNGEFVSNSGLIVHPAWRGKGVARAIKEKIFELSRQKYPAAKVFSITTGMAIMKLNTRLGFEPVIYEALTHDPKFWEKCKSCVNYDILQSKGCKNCLCTAMLFDPVA